ncbi:MAG: transglycosylase SLT domain-containing protein [Kiloniellales bacterium]
MTQSRAAKRRRFGVGLGGCLLLAMLLPTGGGTAAADQLATAPVTDGVMPAVPAPVPRVLGFGDLELYGKIFVLQEHGRWKDADRAIAQLSDRRLMGHVLAQRYLHPTAYRSRYKELKTWLDSYADHPQAERIYKLALKRKPSGAARPHAPRQVTPLRAYFGSDAVDQAPPERSLGSADRKKAARLKRQLRRNVLNTRLSISEEIIEGKNAERLLSKAEIDEIRVDIAAAWYYYGNYPRALTLAEQATARSGDLVPIGHWTAGLAAWRLGNLEAAARHFSAQAQSERLSSWNRAAGSFWAARAYLRNGKPAEASAMLRRAARHKRTFYSLLAERALGVENASAPFVGEVTVSQIAVLEQFPSAARALALLQLGDREMAETELERLGGWHTPEVAEALLAVAETAGLPSLAYKLGSQLAAAELEITAPGLIEAALYPIPPWRPEGGFEIDRALIYALIRQESSFNPSARSPAGARGLMQLMPGTARYMAGRSFRGKKRQQLNDPALNLSLGQRYLVYLLSNDTVGGDLFRLTVAYNGGPGNLAKWQRKVDDGGDPLLFLESLPSRETRLFVERVLTNLWIYRVRLGQPAPALDALAAGDWPAYEALDSDGSEVAQNVQN